jgi:cellulose synthase/poly-beta-1,6-N-acetylglucosamine synthase-like glycosyltransferase
MELPGISVVIISHNEELNIADCLESVTALDYPDASLEIIVVDSSTDRTREIVTSFPRVKLILSPSKGFSEKRNLGYLAAAYELVAFIDADCVAPADWLRRMVPHLRSPEVAAVGGNAYPPPTAPFLGKCIACLGKPAGGAIGLDSEVVFLSQGINYLATCCSLFKKRVLHEVGGFDEGLIYGNEDVSLSEKILNAHYVLEYAEDAFVYHKTRNGVWQFATWAFRRGQSSFHAAEPGCAKILLEPFSLTWIVIGATTLTFIRNQYALYCIVVFFVLCLAFLIRMMTVEHDRIFPTGSNKLKKLYQRRQKIDVSVMTILLVILPLYYLDKLIINIAMVYCKIISFWGEKNPETQKV